MSANVTGPLIEANPPNLTPLPQQPRGVPWPTSEWPAAAAPASSRIAALCDAVFDLPPGFGVTYALLVIREGRMLVERYGSGASPLYMQYSWSMAKSITHALVGILVREGRLDIHAPAAVPEWQDSDDARRTITLDHLLKMRSGLEFNEDYVDGTVSDVIPMLMAEGRHDTGAFAAAKPLIHEPGSEFSYSSGTTNIICRILRDVVGNGPTGMLNFMRDELFEPLGMRSPTPRFDSAGTFIGSSFLFATPQDFARFGYLYLRGGTWDGRTILPAGWVDHARTRTFEDSERSYGAHWWLSLVNRDWFYAGGYDGQRILVLPEKDALIVRLGRTDADHVELVWDRVNALAAAL